MKQEAMILKPIGIIHSPFTSPQGVPIQPTFAKGIRGQVEIFEEYLDGLKDLEGFERIWLLYWFHKSAPVKLTVKPYMDVVERGLFATRAPARPNPIGISAVRLIKIDGRFLHVADLDILDGTPLLDIKPYSPRLDHFDVSRQGWLEKAPGRVVADDRFANGANEVNSK